MDWHALIGVGLLTIGGGIIGLTLFQVAGGRRRSLEVGANMATSAGAILIGLAFQPGVGAHSTPLLAAGGASLISGSLLTARLRRLQPGARQVEDRPQP